MKNINIIISFLGFLIGVVFMGILLIAQRLEQIILLLEGLK